MPGLEPGTHVLTCCKPKTWVPTELNPWAERAHGTNPGHGGRWERPCDRAAAACPAARHPACVREAKRIRINQLIFLDSGFGNRGITGRYGNGFGHRRVLRRQVSDGDVCSVCFFQRMDARQPGKWGMLSALAADPILKCLRAALNEIYGERTFGTSGKPT